MHIAILTFQGFNELDSLVAFGVLNRIKRPDWRVTLCSPENTVTSMNGVQIQRQSSLAEVASADAVLVGSGVNVQDILQNESIMSALRLLNPEKQLIGAQCAGALILAQLGLLHNIPACTDLSSKPWVLEAGVEVLNQPFYAAGNIATAGGCLASQYLGAWVLVRLLGEQAAQDALYYLAPVGEKEAYVERAMKNIMPYVA